MSPHDFEAVRAELDLPPAADTNRFPDEVVAEAATIAAAGLPDVEAATHLPLVTIDPVGSMDLDQAVHLERVGDGFRVHYAIADLGSRIPPGGAVDTEARRRGETVYLPDGRVPLHPPALSEDALSLLPDQVRGAALWTVDVDADGGLSGATVRRALVRSVARLDYEGVQASVDRGDPHPSIEPLADLGRVRRAHRVARGAVELALPEQEVVRVPVAGSGGDLSTGSRGGGATGSRGGGSTGSGDEDGWAVTMRHRLDVDGWNAEVSLLTGMAAAGLMLGAGTGLLRTLPPADERARSAFLRAARALGVPVPDGATPATVLAGLDPDLAASVALMTEATGLLRGAGYVAFDGEPPAQREHAGVGGPYAHVTAPLRRLADRFGLEVCLAVCAGTDVPAWVREALPALPDAMKEADRRASRADRACIDQAEVWELAGRVGETFTAMVARADDEGGEVVLAAPPVVARCRGRGLPEGQEVEVRLAEVDEASRQVVFAWEDPSPSR